MNAERTILALINGNIADAKKSAKRITHAALDKCGRQLLGLSPVNAAAAADYLKSRIDWNTYCSLTAPTWKEDGKGGTETIKSARKPLEEFGARVLEILEGHDEWSADTTDEIATAAIDRKLATTGGEGMFIRTKAGKL